MPPITDPVVIDLVRRVQARLTPENYDQKRFCGSACCIAGHACIEIAASYPDASAHAAAREAVAEQDTVLVENIALKAFGLPNDSELFSAASGLYWPEPLCSDWENARKLPLVDRAKAFVDIARRRLDHFLETGE
jgi:hypothetical protein